MKIIQGTVNAPLLFPKLYAVDFMQAGSVTIVAALVIKLLMLPFPSFHFNSKHIRLSLLCAVFLSIILLKFGIKINQQQYDDFTPYTKGKLLIHPINQQLQTYLGIHYV